MTGKELKLTYESLRIITNGHPKITKRELGRILRVHNLILKGGALSLDCLFDIQNDFEKDTPIRSPAKVTEDDLFEIYKHLKQGLLKNAEIARTFDISEQMVSAIERGVIYKQFYKKHFLL